MRCASALAGAEPTTIKIKPAKADASLPTE